MNDEGNRARRPVGSMIAIALALAAGSGMALPAGLKGEPADMRRRELRCGGYPTPPTKPREPTPEEIAAAKRREKRAAKRAEQVRKAAKGGA